MNRVEITQPVGLGMFGLTHMQVCAVADATDEEILEVCNNRNPSGTSHGWSTVERRDREGYIQAPVQCGEHKDRLHFMVGC